MSRPVQVDFSVKEARAIAAALDLSAHIMDCVDDSEDSTDLRLMSRRMVNGAECAELEEQLGL